MKPERISIGTTVRVREHQRIAVLSSMVGRIADCYGAEGYMAVDVHFPDGEWRLLWPEDLEEISSPPAVGAFANRRWLVGEERVQKHRPRELHSHEPPKLPEGYCLDLAEDPDAPALRRPDGTVAARFGVRGMTYEAVEQAALEDLLHASGEPESEDSEPVEVLRRPRPT
jgi:hypothetical protein